MQKVIQIILYIKIYILKNKKQAKKKKLTLATVAIKAFPMPLPVEKAGMSESIHSSAFCIKLWFNDKIYTPLYSGITYRSSIYTVLPFQVLYV